MSCTLSRWWWGVPGLAALWLLAVLVAAPRIETTIADAARAALARDLGEELRTVDGRPWGGLEASGRDVALAGVAPSDAARRLATAALDRVNGARRIVDGSQLLPSRSPFAWSAERDGGRLTLSGAVAPDGARKRIVDAVRAVASDASVTDRMEVARGSTPAGAAAKTFGVALLAHLEPGRVTVSDNALTATGRARDAAAFDAAMSALNAPPAGVLVASANVARPAASPFTFTVHVQPGSVRVTGFSPDAAARDGLLALARGRWTATSDDLRLASNAPPAFVEAARFAIELAALMSEGSVAMSDQTLSANATARDGTAFAEALRRVAQLPAGLASGAVIVRPPLRRPFTTTVEKRADGVLVFSGAVPDDEAREAALARARALFERVEDRLERASGAPAGLDVGAALRFAVERLADLREGRAELVDATLTLDGEANGPDGWAAARAGFEGSAAPAGVRLARAALREGDLVPYRFQVVRGETGAVLSGHVPDEASRRDVLDAARARLAGDDVVDRLGVAKGAPRDFGAAARAAIRAAARLATGTVALVDRTLTTEGAWLSPGGASGLSAADLGLPPAFALENRAQAAAAPAEVDVARCGALVSERLERARIQFETGSARIDDVSEGLLFAVAAALLRCPTARVEVAGHTDDVGEEEANRRLSEARAEAVAAALAGAGVSRERIVAVGHGSSQPREPNDSDANRARNRRIDIVVHPL